MEQPEQLVRLSVKNMVGFLMHSGSLDNRFGGTDRANEGSRIHRKLQKAGGDGYQPEVFLSHIRQYRGITYHVEGRADGILLEDGRVTVDEIKTTAYPSELITEDFDRAHWGQAMCYAYFYSVQNQLESITVRLTYFQVDTEEIKRYYRECTLSELEAFYLNLLEQYQVWAELQSSWNEVRGGSIQSLPFPFQNYRRGQRELAVAVYRTIQRRGRLFCQAPTGIGKTVSTLYPAVKSMGEGMTEKIFYLTAKTITRQAAEDAFAHMRRLGLRAKSVTLTAKDKICFQEVRECNPDACPYAEGYYDKVNDALFALLQASDHMTRSVIEDCAREHQLCPFELSLDLTLWCDAIICDYNYLFDPVVSLKRFFSEAGGEYAFLVDEAHNLVDRSRSMYSACLSKATVLSLKKKCRDTDKSLSRALNKLNQELIALNKECGEEDYLVKKELPENLVKVLYRFSAHCDEWLQKHKNSPIHEEVLQFYFEASFFQRIAELFDEHYVTYLRKTRNQLDVNLLCLDPSPFLDECMKLGRSSILFSATLSPPDYYVSVLGGGETAQKYLLPSPFDHENLCLLVADRVSTKYNDREQSLSPIAEMLYTMISGKTGNYLAYFPSYKYLNDVYDRFRELYPQITTLQQTGQMEEEEREAFLSRFDSENEQTLLGFCVLGGIYSEGIDLQGDRLIGTAVIGVGLPQISVEQDILKDYFNKKCGMGYEFSYRFPGMNKVLQAAGRVIRGEQDRGVVLLIDSRFSSAPYRALYPDHWDGYRLVRSPGELEQKVTQFWGNPPKKQD